MSGNQAPAAPTEKHQRTRGRRSNLEGNLNSPSSDTQPIIAGRGLRRVLSGSVALNRGGLVEDGPTRKPRICGARALGALCKRRSPFLTARCKSPVRSCSQPSNRRVRCHEPEGGNLSPTAKSDQQPRKETGFLEWAVSANTLDAHPEAPDQAAQIPGEPRTDLKNRTHPASGIH